MGRRRRLAFLKPKSTKTSDRLYHLVKPLCFSTEKLSGSKLRQNLGRRAYLAGVLDSDGCIMIINRKSSGYGAQITISQVIPDACILAYELYGGFLGITHRNLPSFPQQVWWSVGGRTAAQVLDDLMPYLKGKRQQAELALELEKLRHSIRQENSHRRRHHRSRALTNEELEKMKELFLECRRLKSIRPNYVALTHRDAYDEVFSTKKQGEKAR